MKGVEYRVNYVRTGWARSTKEKTRTFKRLHDAYAYLAKLRGNGRPELSPIVIRLHVRDVSVSPWRAIDALPTDPTTPDEQS